MHEIRKRIDKVVGVVGNINQRNVISLGCIHSVAKGGVTVLLFITYSSMQSSSTKERQKTKEKKNKVVFHCMIFYH